MYRIALKMLIEDTAKYIGLILSLSFSALIITQQAAIFTGIMRRTYSTIYDTPQADIWVMDPNVRYVDDILPMRYSELYRVRSIAGIQWAVPYYKGLIRARMADGRFQTCILIGIDDNTLIGGPPIMLEGNLEDLRWPDAIVVNIVGASDKLAHNQGTDKPLVPLHVGEQLELNDRRANVVGICDITRPFLEQPVIFTTYLRATSWSPYERKELSFIIVKSDGTVPPKELCKKIAATTGLAAYTQEDFETITLDYYLKYTGIPINFGLAVFLGMLIGAAIAGQIFYNFVSDNIKYLALFSIMGAQRELLAKMTFLQALWVAVLGWGIGTGLAALIGFLTRHTTLSFYLSWQLFLGTGIIIFFICFMASIISIAKIYRIELATIFKQ